MSQIVKKFIGNDQVDYDKIRLSNNGAIRARNNADTNNVSLLLLDTNDIVILSFGENCSLELDNPNSSAQLYAGNRRLYIDTGVIELRDDDDSTSMRLDTGNVVLVPEGATGVLRSLANVVEFKSQDGASSRVQFFDNDNSNYVGLRSPATVSSNVTFTLPGADGTSGQVLSTNGSGVLSWAPSASSTPKKETFTLSAGDITNQYLDLTQVAKTDSIHFVVKGGAPTVEGASHDYSVNYSGGAGGKTRITFLNDLAIGGGAALVAGDVVQIVYIY